MLVSEWEKSKSFGNRNKREPEEKPRVRDSRRVDQTFRQSRYLSESEDTGDENPVQVEGDVDRVRKSLNNVLESLSDREGLTDDELKNKV